MEVILYMLLPVDEGTAFITTTDVSVTQTGCRDCNKIMDKQWSLLQE
jgi:hypothetical protein